MLSWIRRLRDRLLGSPLSPEETERRIKERQREARLAVANKHEKEGVQDVRLGKKTGDENLVRTGRQRLAVASGLRSNERSLLTALRIYDEVEDDLLSDTDGGPDGSAQDG